MENFSADGEKSFKRGYRTLAGNETRQAFRIPAFAMERRLLNQSGRLSVPTYLSSFNTDDLAEFQHVPRQLCPAIARLLRGNLRKTKVP